MSLHYFKNKWESMTTLNEKLLRDNSPPTLFTFTLILKFKFMKCVFFFAVIFFTSIILSSSSCKKSGPPTCGCDAPTKATIPDSANLIGTIYFSEQQNILLSGFYFKNSFFIVYVENNCGNCIHHMGVCNENILPIEILNLKNDNTKNLKVKFAGHLKPVCEKQNAPGDYTYEHILLTKIEIQ